MIQGRSTPTPSSAPEVYSISPAAIWRFLRRQPLSYWLICIYLFLEYVRPQDMYQQIHGPAYTQATIILALVAFLFERSTIRFGAPELLLAIFSLVVVLSAVTAVYPPTAYDKLPDYLSWVVIFVLIANTVKTEERFLVFALSFLLYGFKMSEYGTRSWAQDGFAFRPWGTTGAPGFFQNSGDFGVQMCIFLPMAVAFIHGLRHHWPRWQQWLAWAMAGTAITGIVASSSRGALIGLVAVGLWGAIRSRRKGRAILAGLVLAGLIYAILPEESKTRFEQAGEDQTSVARTTMWKHAIEIMGDFPVLGIGLNNWVKYHDTYYGGRGTMTHNIFMEAGSELGYTGLIAFLMLIGCTFVVNRRTRKLAASYAERGRFILFMTHGLDGALVGFIVTGFFTTVLYYPFFWINFALTVALHNSALNTLTGSTVKSAVRRVPQYRGGLARVRAAS